MALSYSFIYHTTYLKMNWTQIYQIHKKTSIQNQCQLKTLLLLIDTSFWQLVPKNKCSDLWEAAYESAFPLVLNLQCDKSETVERLYWKMTCMQQRNKGMIVQYNILNNSFNTFTLRKYCTAIYQFQQTRWNNKLRRPHKCLWYL